jgi:glycerol dehydrogenase
MAIVEQYDPSQVYGTDIEGHDTPRAFIAPGAYVQGAGVLDRLGTYLKVTGTTKPAIVISEGGRRRFGNRLEASLKGQGLTAHWQSFGGESSFQEIDRVVAAIESQAPGCDALIAVGAGKCCDAAKAMAHRLDIPVIVCPTLASTDAPCSALSVIYTPEGQMESVEYYPKNPALVVVDTQIVAEAPERYLVAGLADALATWYEARVCFNNPKARSSIGGNTTLAAAAIGELCAKTIYAHADGAIAAVRDKTSNAALEHIVEANTLLSGIGFESGGLAIAHSVATAFTAIPEVEEHCLHGEMVAIGLLTQLALEGDAKEEQKVADFFLRVGLPVHLGHLGIYVEANAALLDMVGEIAVSFPMAANEPFEVTPASMRDALLAIHGRGLDRAETCGDAAYRKLR